MEISYKNLVFYEFIEELEREKVRLQRREDLKIKNRILLEIQEERERVSQIIQGLDTHEQDWFISDFQEFEAEKMVEYFNEISEKFQKAYAIFENQIAKIGKGKLFEFKLYPKIEEVNNAVNVLKHGKGKSYNALENSGSKFLKDPTEILSLEPEMPAKAMLYIVKSKYSGVILNLEHTDVIDFLDEAKSAWVNMITANAESGKSTKNPAKEL